MIAVVSRLQIHIGDVLHISRPLETLVFVLLIVGPYSPLCPFLSPRWLTVYALLPVVEVVDHVVIVILSVKLSKDYSLIEYWNSFRMATFRNQLLDSNSLSFDYSLIASSPVVIKIRIVEEQWPNPVMIVMGRFDLFQLQDWSLRSSSFSRRTFCRTFIGCSWCSVLRIPWRRVVIPHGDFDVYSPRYRVCKQVALWNNA